MLRFPLPERLVYYLEELVGVERFGEVDPDPAARSVRI